MKKALFSLLGLSLLFFYSCSNVSLTEEEKQVESLLSQMTLDEKIGQMNQLSYWGTNDETINRIKNGNIGSLLNIVDPVEINNLQKIAVEESRLGIPLIIGRDVIHGFKTIFPIPLGQAASFSPEIVEIGAAIAAKEARSVGVNWTFAPMLDISRDPRWGRIAECLGEDPYVTSVLGASMVKGFQGDELGGENSIAACVKHFIGYGAAEGGRDYNSTNIPERLMRNVYLPPFKAAIDAGAATLMTSFNDNDGIPASANSHILRTILRDEWNFDGFVVSDWASMTEMLDHGFAYDRKDVAKKSAIAGVDMEMVSQTYVEHLEQLVKDGEVSIKDVDNAVRNILRVKIRLGLFENPYVDIEKESVMYAEEHLDAARKAAVQSAILLKNDNNILPLKENTKIAVIGPLANAPHEQMGTWVFDGDKKYSVTPIDALKSEYKHIKHVFEPTLEYSRDTDKSKFEKAKAAIRQSDVAVLFLGEEAILSGEAHCLSDINLIGVQSELLKEAKSVGKPVILVIMAGRPLTIERDLPYADAVLFNFHPGTMGGPAMWDLIFGKENPSGKLPVTFPRHVGQIPMYYNHNNTGRPAPEEITTLDKIPLEAGQTSLGNTSFYLDYGKDPLFPFGYGLSYSNFKYDNLTISANEIGFNDKLNVSVNITNDSDIDGFEVVQLYIQDVVGSIARPVKELKKFDRIYIEAGNTINVEFELTADDLAFYGLDLTKKAEPGEFNLWVGGSSQAELQEKFVLR